MKIKNSRRQFLQSSSALLLSVAASSPKLAFSATSSSSEDYWEMVRSQFSFTENAVPMNAANLCPSLRAVTEKVDLLTADIDQDCSFNNRVKFNGLQENTRTLVADQLHVSRNEIALVRNTSEANNIVNNGLQLQSGNEVLIWDQNHPTNNVAWEVRAARFGFSLNKVATPSNPASTDELVTAFTSQMNSRTKVLSITHVSNVSGIRLPVKEIVNVAKSRGIYVHLDGAQVWGAMSLDLKELGVDSFSASAHKWYMGPKEVGILYVREENIERIWPSVVAPGWGDGPQTSLEGARKFESLGQRDDAALAALGVAAEIHNTIGVEKIERRIVQLAQQLKTGISDAGFELVTPMDPALSFGVCITKVPAGGDGSILNRLYTEYGIAGAGTGGVRLCPTIYNTTEHVERAVRGVGALLTTPM